jgi:hypothetical protein
MSGGIPVTITNAGAPVTSVVGGMPVTLVGGTAAAVTTGQVVSMEVNGTPDVEVTFTVVNGVITEITHA